MSAPLVDRLLGRASAHHAKGATFDAQLMEEAANALRSQQPSWEGEGRPTWVIEAANKVCEELKRCEEMGIGHSYPMHVYALAAWVRALPAPPEGEK